MRPDVEVTPIRWMVRHAGWTGPSVDAAVEWLVDQLTASKGIRA